MAITTSYLNSTKNLESILNSIIGARAPERFTSRFLEDLGFKSSSDRLIIGILKSLGFIDENGVPKLRNCRITLQLYATFSRSENVPQAKPRRGTAHTVLLYAVGRKFFVTLVNYVFANIPITLA